jgi:hypothetical protein
MKQQEKFERVTKKRVSAEIKQDVPISWKSISMQMSQAVQDLNKTILRGDAGQLQIKVAGVVDVVRLMIYASRSSDKESPHLQVPQIRDPHRQVMTTLSKLILSAKAVPDTQTDFTKRLLTKVHNDTNELSNAVRKFIQACQVKNVLIEPINPRLIETRASEVDNNKVITNTFDSIQSPESSTIEERRSSNPKTIITDTASKTKYVLNQDLLVNIQSHAKQIMGTTNALCDASTNIYSIEQQNSQVVSEPDEEDEHYQKSDEEKFFLSQRSRSCVVILFQNLSTQVGQYLSILRDVDLSKVDSTQIPTLPEFQISKQKLFNSIGLLFSSVQTLTDINHNLRASINSVEESVKSVEDAIDTIISNLHQMVAERKMWMRKNEALTNTAAAEDETGSHSPIYSYFDLPTSSSTEGTPKFGTRPHRGSVNESDSESGALSKRLLQTINQHRPSVSTAVSKSMIRPGNDNIKRPLGYTHPNSSNIDTSSEYWYLGHDYPEEDLVFTAEKTIKGGTLAALVERLTLHNFIGTFSSHIKFDFLD